MEIEILLKRDQELINRELRQVFRKFRGIPTQLKTAMHYAVFSGGKRLRPILTLESYRACGGKKLRWIMPLCCGIELIHTFSLVHDDLPAMDNDDFRRGKLAVHRQFDEGTAILAGDALFAWAFELFAASSVSPENRIKAIQLISQAVGPAGMAGGQMYDIGKSAKTVMIARLKTAELIAASICVGALIARAPEKLLEKLRHLGLMFGVLFQLTDDILDFEQDAIEKRRGKMISLSRRAQLLSMRVVKGFSALGDNFSFFAQLSEAILKRRD